MGKKKTSKPAVSWYEYKRLREYQRAELKLAYEGVGIELLNLSITYARCSDLDMQAVGEYEQARGKIIGEALVLLAAIDLADEEIQTANRNIGGQDGEAE